MRSYAGVCLFSNPGKRIWHNKSDFGNTAEILDEVCSVIHTHTGAYGEFDRQFIIIIDLLNFDSATLYVWQAGLYCRGNKQTRQVCYNTWMEKTYLLAP